MDSALLRAHLDGAADAVTVAEAPTAADHGWFDGRAHEIVIPLATTAPPARAPTVVTSPAPLPLIEREHSALPGFVDRPTGVGTLSLPTSPVRPAWLLLLPAPSYR